MDTTTLQPGQLYAIGNPASPDRVVLIDALAWRWDSRDAGPDRRRTFVPRSGRRMQYKGSGPRTGINTGSLVLRVNKPASPSVAGNNSLLLAVEPITVLRRGITRSGTGNGTGLVDALTQGPDGEFRPWVCDLLIRHGLHFDLIDPKTIVSTWADWEAGAAARDAEIAAAEAEAQQGFDAHDALVESVATRLAELGVTYSRSGRQEAQVADLDDRTVSMTYEVLAELLSRIS